MNESSLIEPAQKLQVCKNMLAIASGKGGVGKTWLSVTLAQALAQRNGRVLLFDGDLGLANVDIQLGLQPGKDLSGALADNYPLAEAATRHPGAGFEVIAGRSGTGGLAGLPASQMAGLLHDLIVVGREIRQVMQQFQQIPVHGTYLAAAPITQDPGNFRQAVSDVLSIGMKDRRDILAGMQVVEAEAARTVDSCLREFGQHTATQHQRRPQRENTAPRQPGRGEDFFRHVSPPLCVTGGRNVRAPSRLLQPAQQRVRNF